MEEQKVASKVTPVNFKGMANSNKAYVEQINDRRLKYKQPQFH